MSRWRSWPVTRRSSVIAGTVPARRSSCSTRACATGAPGARLGAAGRDVVAYDRRGFGDVAPAGGPFRHVDDLLAVLDAVSPDTPAWVVGSSMGGEVALDASLEAPERIAGLVLLAPAVSGDPELD